MNLPERIERIVRIVREWDQWSPAEQRRMDEIVEEVLTYARTGKGNGFIRKVWDRVFRPFVDHEDSGEGPFDTKREAQLFAYAEVGVPYLIHSFNGKWHILLRQEYIS